MPDSHLSRRHLLFTLGALAAAAGSTASLKSAGAQSILERILGGGSSGGGTQSGGLSTADVVLGLKEALTVASGRVVQQVGQVDGYNLDPQIHIPLPENLKTVQNALQVVGQSHMADELELRMNRAAERAAPRAKDVFFDAIKQMSIQDAWGIYNGPDDSATRYFERTMTPDLKREFRPIITDELSDTGAMQSYDRMMGRYRNMPFVPDVRANLTDYALGKALEGIFFYLGREERAIRQNPAKRTTDVLRRVFG